MIGSKRNLNIAIDYLSGVGSLRDLGKKHGVSHERISQIVINETRYIKYYGSYVVYHPCKMKQVMAKKDILLKILLKKGKNETTKTNTH